MASAEEGGGGVLRSTGMVKRDVTRLRELIPAGAAAAAGGSQDAGSRNAFLTIY